MVSSSFAEVLKDETIYVNLDHSGKAQNIRVVNRLHGKGQEDYYIDYGSYENVKPLVDLDPVVEKDRIKWPLKDAHGKDIYYEATIDKDLPVKLNIKYFLDGKKIPAEELVGKSGKLKIDILVENESSLTSQIQIPLNLDVFSNIEVENGAGSVVGKTMTVVFTHLPIGEGEFSIEAEGKNIELESILISSTNFKMPISGDLDEFLSGIDELARAFDQLEEGSKEINKGTISLRDGIKVLADGIGEIYSGFSQISSKTKEILEGFNQFNLGFKTLKNSIVDIINGIGELNSNFETAVQGGNNIDQGLNQLNKGTKDLDKGLKEINSGLGDLNSNHKQLVQLAQSLQNSQDPSVRALAEGVIGEGLAIEGLSKGLNESYKGVNAIAENTNQLYLGYGEYNKGINEILKGYRQLGQGLQPMPEEIENMYKGHNQLTDGLGSLSDGLDSIDSGLEEMNKNTKTLPNQVGKLAEGQKELTDGISELNKEGISKIRDVAQVFTDITGDEQDEYKSFVDSRNKDNSTCQFVMKTPPIKAKQVKELAKVEETGKRTLLQRFLYLFRR